MSHLERLKQAEARLAAERQAAREAVYRAALRRAFELAGQGAASRPAECALVLDQLAALTDDVGASRADHLRHEEAARWRASCGRCPFCGEPAHEEEPA